MTILHPLLVPLMRVFQRRLNNASVCWYADGLMRHAEQDIAAKHR